MRNLMLSLTLASLLATPAQANSLDYQSSQVRPGAFVGARLKLSLGGQFRERPKAVLTISPTRTRISANGMPTTKIGDGVALNFTAGTKPTLELGGVSSSAALTRRQGHPDDPSRKMGVSTTAWVVVGTVVVAAGIGFALLVDSARDNTD